MLPNGEIRRDFSKEVAFELDIKGIQQVKRVGVGRTSTALRTISTKA